MTPEQRNDLCIEWEQTCTSLREQLLNEYKQEQAASSGYEDWENFIVRRLGLQQFWETVGLA